MTTAIAAGQRVEIVKTLGRKHDGQSGLVVDVLDKAAALRKYSRFQEGAVIKLDRTGQLVAADLDSLRVVT